MTMSQSHAKTVTWRLEVKGLADHTAMQKRIVEYLAEDMRGNTEALTASIAKIRLNVFNSQRAQFFIRAKHSKDVKYMEALIGNTFTKNLTEQVAKCCSDAFQECWTRGA